MPSIDVAVPCYQYGRFLRECVTSITRQDVDGLRVLVIDNGSTDDSLAVARDLAAADARVEILTVEENRGANWSYNAGIDWASADYFLLVDADDMLAPGSLRRALDVLVSCPRLAFCFGAEARLYEDGTIERDAHAAREETWHVGDGEALVRELCRTPVNRICAASVVRRTREQKRIGHYRKSLPFTDDLELWLRLATTGEVAETREVQAIRRIHRRQMTAAYKGSDTQVRDFREREAAFESFFANEGCRIADREALMARVRRGLAEHAYWSAVSHLVRGYPRTALALMRFSLAHKPRALVLPPVGWLLRMHNPAQRAGQVLQQMISGGRA